MKSALVTGGSSGIGLAIARMLKAEGFELTLVARRPEKLAAVAEELVAEAIAVNLVEEGACARVVASHSDRWGGLDVLVNSAGVGFGGSFSEQAAKHIDLQLEVNLRATLLVTQAALPFLRASHGTIVTLASIAGTLPAPGLAVYGATKAALISFAHSLNREEAMHGIRACTICPGFVATPMAEWTGLPAEEMIQPDDIAELVRALLRLSPQARVPTIVVERLGDAV
jgi:NADP-dependent 3-hydroxy acid dehydrogenase YdfG